MIGPPGRAAFGLVLGGVVLGCSFAASATTERPLPAVEVTIASATGETLAFEPTEVDVSTGLPVDGRVGIGVVFRNRSSLSHNVTFIGTLTAGTRTIVDPGMTDRIVIYPPAPGAYPFVCTVHDGMAGLLVVRSEP